MGDFRIRQLPRVIIFAWFKGGKNRWKKSAIVSILFRGRVMSKLKVGFLVILFGASLFALRAESNDEGCVALFPNDGVPKDWLVRGWHDVSKEAPKGVEWTVKDGVLHSGKERGTWLMSEKEYTDFVLEFEVKLTERGNSGVALKAPLKGDTAFDGIELQLAAKRYNPEAKDSEITR